MRFHKLTPGNGVNTIYVKKQNRVLQTKKID